MSIVGWSESMNSNDCEAKKLLSLQLPISVSFAIVICCL